MKKKNESRIFLDGSWRLMEVYFIIKLKLYISVLWILKLGSLKFVKFSYVSNLGKPFFNRLSLKYYIGSHFDVCLFYMTQVWKMKNRTLL